MNNKFFAYKHQNKADVLIEALTAAGWVKHPTPEECKFVLSDSDVYGRGRTIDELASLNIPSFIYPHAAIPAIFWDFEGINYTRARAAFVTAAGHIEIMRAYGVPYDMDVIGWYYCDIKPFMPRESFKRVLFMPIHPNNNGFLADVDKDINARAFRMILDIRKKYNLEIRVRHLKSIEQNGLARVENVEYIEGKPDLSTEEIDSADVVVAHHTPAFMAVARGVPCVMMGEHKTPRFCTRVNEVYFAKSWNKYKHLMIYPFDVLAADDLGNMFATVISGDRIIADWRRRLIGDQFKPAEFVKIIENRL